MTRIGAGEFKGRLLQTPDGDVTRPTAAKVRSALANALQATGALAGARVLDLFAGSGALGLELLSRGADAAVFVENDRRALNALRHNISALGVGVRTEVLAADVAHLAGRLHGGFDIVVADPPYGWPVPAWQSILSMLVPHLVPGADVVIERGRRDDPLDWPAPLELVRERQFGDTLLCYGRAP